jgi:hypothetical protein
MRSYYAFAAAIRYYRQPLSRVEQMNGLIVVEDAPSALELVDLRTWREPPHPELANLRPDGLLALWVRFTRRYGVISERASGGVRYVSPADIGRFGDYLRQAWDGDEKVLEQMLVDLNARLRVLPRGVDIVIEDLWTLVRLMFLRDWLFGRARKCARTDCPTPYFLAVRKGQKFCSHKCAVLLNVRRFRAAQRRAQKMHPKRKPDRKLQDRARQGHRIKTEPQNMAALRESNRRA